MDCSLLNVAVLSILREGFYIRLKEIHKRFYSNPVWLCLVLKQSQVFLAEISALWTETPELMKVMPCCLY